MRYMNCLESLIILPVIILCLIDRSLQVYMKGGVPHSQLLEEQRGQDGGDCLGGPLRFRDPCIFWLHSNMDGMKIHQSSQIGLKLTFRF